MPILPRDPDPRLVAVRRGGSLTDEHHRLLASWALDCADHVLPLFERGRPGDLRVRDALEIGRAWVRGEATMTRSRLALSGHDVGRGLPDAARFAALSTAQACAVAHVAAHDLGAAAYAIRAVVADGSGSREEERDRQRARIPDAVRALVLDDQRRRSPLCWDVFD